MAAYLAKSALLTTLALLRSTSTTSKHATPLLARTAGVDVTSMARLVIRTGRTVAAARNMATVEALLSTVLLPADANLAARVLSSGNPLDLPLIRLALQPVRRHQALLQLKHSLRIVSPSLVLRLPLLPLLQLRDQQPQTAPVARQTAVRSAATGHRAAAARCMAFVETAALTAETDASLDHAAKLLSSLFRAHLLLP